ncbi:MAG: hypothetical protein JWP81_2804 [Ferruginibacter sp.]|nr:hypothetical protein [Ferruginibacter sp.]
MKTELRDERYKFWDILIKAVSSLLTISTIIIALLTYRSNQKAELKQKEREFRREISLRQINYYSEISQAIGELLTTLNYPDSLFSKTYYSKRNNFETLYFGKMNLINSKSVDNQLQIFHGLLEKYEVDNPDVKINDLRLAAFKVNDSFRESVRETFDVKLDISTK